MNWRLYPGGAKEFGVGEYELGNRFCEGKYQKNVSGLKFTINADRLVPGGWCHVNRNATVAEMMKVYDYYQATGDLGKPDLLSNRVFGGVTRSASAPHDVLFLTAITCLHPCKDEAEWLRRTNEMLDRDGWDVAGEEAKRAEHIAAWAKFWERSHIVVAPATGVASKLRKDVVFPTNDKLPLSFGAEYWYAETFAVRGGYFFEHENKGGRQYATVGFGLRYNIFAFDFSYLIPTTVISTNPLSNTIRIQLTMNLKPTKAE